VKDVLLLDVTPLPWGSRPWAGIMTKVDREEHDHPDQGGADLLDRRRQSTGVTIHVLQGERDRARTNKSLRRFDLGRPYAPAPGAAMPRDRGRIRHRRERLRKRSSAKGLTASEQRIVYQWAVGQRPVEPQSRSAWLGERRSPMPRKDKKCREPRGCAQQGDATVRTIAWRRR